MSKKFFEKLEKKAKWVRKETLKIHGILPETRLASSLSDVEIFTSLFYGKILKFNTKNWLWEKRDRFIVSKPHGAISLYPILFDLGFISKEEFKKIGKASSFLGGIPDGRIPTFEITCGALGHGLGVGCGMALALKKKGLKSKVFVLMGDGELQAGIVWEAIMFAGHHKLNNLILIIDNNKISMLDYVKNTINLEPLEKKFNVFQWETERIDGHNIEELYYTLKKLKQSKSNHPKVLIADTIKGKGVPELENDPLCHIKSFKKEEVDEIIKKYYE
jgi:transketolase